jgi:hypothetical protein
MLATKNVIFARNYRTGTINKGNVPYRYFVNKSSILTLLTFPNVFEE